MQTVLKAKAAPIVIRDTELGPREFATLAELVHARTGIVLGPGKQSMVFSRLVRRLRACGLDSFEAYCSLLDSAAGGDEMVAFTNAMTTNLTRFFREPHHFEFLRDTAFPRIAAGAGRRLRIWSAGCSSGEEPYSIAITMREHFPGLPLWDARILATDIDTTMVQRGQKGEYSDESVSEMPVDLRDRYFSKAGERYVAREAIRDLITFNSLNLLGDWPMQGRFDIIFCRNVMIYFDNPTKTELVRRFSRYLTPGGWLIVGHSETLLDQQKLYTLRGRTIYQQVAGGADAK